MIHVTEGKQQKDKKKHMQKSGANPEGFGRWLWFGSHFKSFLLQGLIEHLVFSALLIAFSLVRGLDKRAEKKGAKIPCSWKKFPKEAYFSPPVWKRVTGFGHFPDELVLIHPGSWKQGMLA